MAVDKLRKYFLLDDGRKVTLTSSGHTALMAAYAAVGAKNVLMPAYTFESTRAAATLQGINVILVDSEVNNPCLTVDKIKEISLSSYDTVVVVCPLSIIPDLKSISDFCRENNKKLIVDGAATFGTTNDNSIFNYGDVFCMSFHATKTLSVGECGCTMANEELSDKIKKYITFGFDDSRTPVMVGMNAKVSDSTC
jgi:dTDP-4-amino-4,6-dideoxygalactose transaminase